MASRQPSQPPTGSTLHRNLLNHAIGRKMPGSSVLPTYRVAQPFENTDSDILMRDESGNYRLEQPMLTPSQRNEQKDNNETESQLIETYRKHQEHVDLSEFQATLQSSLQAKVASLEEDKWIFEGGSLS